MKRTILVLLGGLSACTADRFGGSVSGLQGECVAPGPDGQMDALQASLDRADTGSTVSLCAGTFVGAARVPRSLTLVAHGASVGGEPSTWLDARGQGAALVVDDGDVTLRGLGFRGGDGTPREVDGDGRGTVRTGGGVDALQAASLTVEQCAFTGNYADLGGALHGPASGALAVSDSRFQDNVGQHGGALYAPGSAVALTALTLLRNAADVGGAVAVHGADEVAFDAIEARENVAQESGGALAVLSSGEVRLTDLTLADNRATADEPGEEGVGGGLLVSGASALTVVDLVAADNRGAVGGAVALLSVGQARLLGAELRDNDVSGAEIDGEPVRGFGGGLYAVRVEDLQVDGLVASDNRAHLGGGLFMQGGTLTLQDADLVDNVVPLRSDDAYGRGGGLALDGVVKAELSGVSLQGNRAWRGGGLDAFSGGSLQLTSSVVAANVGAPGGGLSVQDYGGVRLDAVRVERNVAERHRDLGGGGERGDGGGVALVDVAAAQLSQVELVANMARDGGALAFSTSGVTLEGGLVQANEASNPGGGVRLQSGTLWTAGADWGADALDNLPGDIAIGEDSWAVATPDGLRCDVTGCQ